LEINITKDWDNPLLDRKEITFNISHTGATPSRDEIKNKLVALLNSKHELVIVDKIGTEYGTQNTTGYAKMYSDVDRANEIENKYVLKRNELKPVEEMEKPPGEEAVAEEPAEEAASEEPVEVAASEENVEEAASEEPVEEEPVE
jgi:small subunit ribosomal protein S24e